MTKQKQKGGRVLGQGTYGCVVEPVFPCKDTPANKTKVSKLMSDKESASIKAEIEIAKKLKKIDPTNMYTIYAEDSCMLTSNKLQFIDDEQKKCGHVKNGNNVANLIMPMGGPQLGEILHNNKLTRKELLKILLHLLYGCRLLLNNGIAHFDLSDRNILMVADKNNKVRPIMIDFGLFTPSSFNDMKVLVNTQSKYIWPIEVYSKMSVHRSGITSIVRQRVDVYNKQASFKDYGDKVMVYQLGLIFDTIVSPHKTLKRLFADMRQEMPEDRLTIDECVERVKKLWPGDRAPGQASTPQHLKRIITPKTKMVKDSETIVTDCIKKCLEPTLR